MCILSSSTSTKGMDSVPFCNVDLVNEVMRCLFLCNELRFVTKHVYKNLKEDDFAS